jgi:hypothetical protein
MVDERCRLSGSVLAKRLRGVGAEQQVVVRNHHPFALTVGEACCDERARIEARQNGQNHRKAESEF